MSVLTARPVVAALESRRLDADAILRAAHLSREALASIDNRLPLHSVGALWEAAAKAAHDDSFGVHVAETLPRGAYDLFEHLLATAETVGAGVSRLAQYIRLLHDHSNMQLVVEPGCGRLLRTVPTPAPQYDEFSMALLLIRSREACGAAWSPERMTFQHERVHDDRELARVFGCPLVFGAAEGEMRIPSSVLPLPHVRGDSTVLAVLSRYAESLIASLPAQGSLLARVSSAIARRMATELPTLGTTASDVRIPERTLQRRLADEGVSHSSLVDEVRRNLALKYIGDAHVSITEIGYLLHFADPSVFSRAFKRWTGESPVAYRKRFF